MTEASSPAVSPAVGLFECADIDRLRWPVTEDGRYARNLLQPFIRDGVKSYIDNVDTRLLVLQCGEAVLPVTINEQEYDNSYVCSPYTHYITYAAEELRELKSPLLESILRPFLRTVGLALRQAGINRVVAVNNWLLSTNLYPGLGEDQVRRMTKELVREFPSHAILFRSINRRSDPSLYSALKESSYRMVASRQVYLLDAANPSALSSKARWLLKRDFKLIEQGEYEIVRPDMLKQEDIPRMAELYRMLYLDKYSLHNPQFNEAFFRLALETASLRFIALKKQGRLDAILGYYSRNGVMTTPIFGYDTGLPKETGLYRMLSALLIREAQERKLLLNESSGAAQFKRNRGAEGEVEYTAVYDSHLPLYRRSVWTFLSFLINRVGVPLMQRRKL